MSKFFKSVKNIVITIVAVLIIGMLLGYGASSFKSGSKTTKLGFEDVGELVVQTCHATVIGDSKDNAKFFKKFEIPFTESRQIFSYDIDVDYSLNFEAIKIKSIDDKNKIVKIQMPKVKEYKTTLKEESLKIYLDQGNLFSRIDLSEMSEQRKQMEDQAENDCIANGVMDAANENAKKLLSGFVKNDSKYKDYTFEFEEKDE